MDELKLQTPNRGDENFKKRVVLFSNAVTKTVDENGVVVRAIDKDGFGTCFLCAASAPQAEGVQRKDTDYTVQTHTAEYGAFAGIRWIG